MSMIHVNELLASMNKSMTENEGRKRKEEQISGQVANKPKRNLRLSYQFKSEFQL